MTYKPCTPERAIQLTAYFTDLSTHSWNHIEPETQDALLETHQHLRGCNPCKKGLERIRKLAEDESSTLYAERAEAARFVTQEAALDDILREKEVEIFTASLPGIK